ncbi:hypothetical protein RRF57_008551 [Xylaria bambusicola]|uniref:Uncharacterized protein n=1 Tax=Xylaria bambusicola TaxID=326684 RepID=A0AAN7UTP0_9PEZI
MVKKGTANPDQRPFRKLFLPLLNCRERSVVHDDLVETGLYQTPRDVLELFARLHEEVVPRGDLHRDPSPRVARPDVQTGIPATAVDGEEVEVCVETC